MKEEYSKITTPQELYDFMHTNIKYGIHGTDNKDYIPHKDIESNQKFQYATRNLYSLASPDYLLTHKIGHCWDQVELERDWFLKHNYEIKTLFIGFMFDYENSYSVHTYLIYKDKITSEYCLFEHADYVNRGIHRFKTYKEAVLWQKQKQIETNEREGNVINEEIITHIHIFEYEKPKYGINCDEFINYVLDSNEITDDLEGDRLKWNY